MVRELATIVFEVFPACAGLILQNWPLPGSGRGIPRMCGADPWPTAMAQQLAAYSPHVRG